MQCILLQTQLGEIIYEGAMSIIVFIKEIVERRHKEPIKFLFLPKMGLLGSQASNEKKNGCEL